MPRGTYPSSFIKIPPNNGSRLLTPRFPFPSLAKSATIFFIFIRVLPLKSLSLRVGVGGRLEMRDFHRTQIVRDIFPAHSVGTDKYGTVNDNVRAGKGGQGRAPGKSTTVSHADPIIVVTRAGA